MAIVSLLNANDPAFAFEHMMHHRLLMAAMAPLNRFSAVPYLLDPAIDPQIPAGWFNLDHQQATLDASNALPQNYAGTLFGIPVGNLLIDQDLSKEADLTWLTFANHQWHYTADATVLAPPYPALMFPAW